MATHAGTFACERSGGWLVKVASYPKLALLFVSHPVFACPWTFLARGACFHSSLTAPWSFGEKRNSEFKLESSFQAQSFSLCLRQFRLGPGCRPSRFQPSCPRSAHTAM